jgi:hypothetical protein
MIMFRIVAAMVVVAAASVLLAAFAPDFSADLTLAAMSFLQ